MKSLLAHLSATEVLAFLGYTDADTGDGLFLSIANASVDGFGAAVESKKRKDEIRNYRCACF